VRLEVSTKPHVHRKVEIFWTNIASTMASPNFKNGPKTGLRPLGVNPQINQKLNFKKQEVVFTLIGLQNQSHCS
jgi:hypothetical protein